MISADPLTAILRFGMLGSRSIIDAVSRHQRPKGDGFAAERAGPREHQHVLHDAVQRIQTGDDLEQDGAIALVGRHARRDHLQRAADAGDRVLHLVRDDGSHLTELRERFLLGQPLLELRRDRSGREGCP